MKLEILNYWHHLLIIWETNVGSNRAFRIIKKSLYQTKKQTPHKYCLFAFKNARSPPIKLLNANKINQLLSAHNLKFIKQKLL
jgi:hypothetical protein